MHSILLELIEMIIHGSSRILAKRHITAFTTMKVGIILRDRVIEHKL